MSSTLADEQPVLQPVERGRLEEAVWGDVAIGHVVQDKKFCLHTVVDEIDGWVKLKAVRTDAVASLQRPAAGTPVKIYVPSDAECLSLLSKSLGAATLRDIEERERTLSKSLLWRLDPVGRNAKALRDHIDMIHGGTSVEHFLYETQAATAKRDAPRKKAAIDDMVAVHEEMHRDAHLWPQGFPHHHAKEN